ncbi:MAG: hypothetical protein ACAI34_13725 [Verrucomicrobium sp.]
MKLLDLIAVLLVCLAAGKLQAADEASAKANQAPGRIIQIQESLDKAVKGGDVGAVADLAYEWTSSGEHLKAALESRFNHTCAMLEGKLKDLKARAADGNLPVKSAAAFQEVADALKEQLKQLAAGRNQLEVAAKKLDEAVAELMKRQEIKDLVEVHRTQDEVDKAVKDTQEKLKLLPKL